ncbi:MAG: hypothetical protein IJZ89_02115 [Clostridia bacterium]|nr:hypothetical protein [Clostridia bacterium]
MTEADKLRFEICIRENLLSDRSDGENIGTYKEKRLHRVLKKFCEPDEACHEIPIGAYVADILRGNDIIEIQTGSFYPMKAKIRYYLEETDFSVTIVRPLPHIKWCVWLDPESGEALSRKKSPKKTLPKDVMRDWLFLCDFLGNERLTVKFLLLEEKEYRLLNGWSKDKKRGSKRYERIPIGLIDEVIYCGAEDYRAFLPEELGESFTASEFMKAAKLRSYGGYASLKILCHLGFIEKSEERKGRSFVYKRKGLSR